jgi:hypothetical protein
MHLEPSYVKTTGSDSNKTTENVYRQAPYLMKQPRDLSSSCSPFPAYPSNSLSTMVISLQIPISVYNPAGIIISIIIYIPLSLSCTILLAHINTLTHLAH